MYLGNLLSVKLYVVVFRVPEDYLLVSRIFDLGARDWSQKPSIKTL
jgi:hypothetical protein